MKKILFLFIILLALGINSIAQSAAFQRAERMGIGMNVSYLDNWWKGAKDKHYSDFAKPEEAAKREKMFAEIANAGFKTVRIPICFSAWMQLKQPYEWDNPKALEMADSFVKWALANNLNVIIDLHHSEFDGAMPEAANAERLVNLWVRIAERYKNTDPEKVFFELRNEPHNMSAEAWRWQAEQLIKYVREIAPKHTLIVGFEEWNGRQTMINSKPFADSNIIYTFHYYDPFIFTHQGATWAGVGGIEDVKFLPFPANDEKIKTPDKAKGQWTENLIKSYREDSKAEKMFKDLKAAKDWSTKNNVPIFLGEFGSFSQNTKLEDRCRHAEIVYSALGKLQIPNAWWEWDGGFNMFKTDSTEIADCMRKAIDSFNAQK
ncbi:MAG TPA: glycoside hydrolase family 5 protein [Pyrinomonadaceae bacterium]|nr:glycoside hydrolase family 5 protein [Pyrinomonadaceae bacterium]